MDTEIRYKLKTSFKTLLEATRYFADESVCRKYLEHKRWGDKVTCIHCGSDVMRLGDGKTYKCKKCRRKFSLTSGTVFQNSNLPLRTWLPAIYLVTSRWKGLSSVQLAKDLGVQQTTAWFMGHKIREMILAQNVDSLGGIVEIDDAYIKDGNKLGARTAKISGLQGRSLKVKTPLIAMKQRDGKVILVAVSDTKKATVQDLVTKHITKGTVIVTDSHPSYAFLSKESNYKHVMLNHKQGEYKRDGYHTNTVEGFWAYVKQCAYGTHHWVSSKYLSKYCAEWAFKFNTCANAKARNRGKNADRFEKVMDMFRVQAKNKKIVSIVPDYAIAA